MSMSRAEDEVFFVDPLDDLDELLDELDAKSDSGSKAKTTS